MGRAIKVLLIDDNTTADFFEPIADLASNLIQCELVQVPTWDKAQKLLDENPYEFHGLIVDGKGQKNMSSKGEDDSFLAMVLPKLRDRAREGVGVPYVVYSGWADELKRYYADEPIFWKGKDEENDMLQYLRNAIVESSEVYKARQLYPEIFELFDMKVIFSKYERDMVDILDASNNNFTGNRGALIRSLRPILENTFDTLRKKDGSFFPGDCYSKGTADVSKIIRFLAGSFEIDKQTGKGNYHSQRIISTPLFYLLRSFQDLTSRFMHNNGEIPSNYLVRSCTNALLEYLMWYKQFIKDNYAK